MTFGLRKEHRAYFELGRAGMHRCKACGKDNLLSNNMGLYAHVRYHLRRSEYPPGADLATYVATKSPPATKRAPCIAGRFPERALGPG